MVQLVEITKMSFIPCRWANCIFYSYVHSAVYLSKTVIPGCRRFQKKRKRTQRGWVDGEILHAGNKSSRCSRCGGAASNLQRWPYCLSIWVVAHCGRAFRMAFTSSATAVSANSNWSWSGRRTRGRVSRVGGMKHESDHGSLKVLRWKAGNRHALGSDGTLVRTKPGLWSRMCSREAAMSISFTPGNEWTRRGDTWASCC